MKIAHLCIAAFLLASSALAADRQVIPVWNGVAPGSETWTYTEESNASERDKSLNLRNIVTPTITVYPAAKPNGTGMLVIPGGGFVNLAYGKEGEEIAARLNSLGVTAFVLKYRLARTGDEDAKSPDKMRSRLETLVPLAVQDALQAMRILKPRAAEWAIKPGRFGVIGFSAGGLLTVGTAVWLEGTERPDFVVPVYAAPPRQYTVRADTPPAFFVLAEDDRYGTDGSIQLYSAWHNAHRPVELHIYAKGNHGFALRKNNIPTDSWFDRLTDWMTTMGFLN
jgi:acetyl esterase/lipase